MGEVCGAIASAGDIHVAALLVTAGAAECANTAQQASATASSVTDNRYSTYDTQFVK